MSHVLKKIPDIAARFRDDVAFAERLWDDGAVAIRPRDDGAVAERLLDGDTFSHPRALSVILAKAGISLSSLARLIRGLRKVSHVFKEIPDIAARFRDDEPVAERLWDDGAVAIRSRDIGAVAIGLQNDEEGKQTQKRRSNERLFLMHCVH